MRITCQSIEAFMRNVEDQDVFLNTVHEQSSKIEVTDNSRYEVYYKLSAILDYGDDGQALVESGELCGVDRPNSDEFDGTDRLKELQEEVHSWCAGRHLSVKPGVLDI